MFREWVQAEFESRKRRDPRYSLRRFAAWLNLDHSTLSQVLRGQRRATARQIRSIAAKLGASREEISVYLAAEQVPDATTLQRQSLLHHWTAEALAVVRGPVHQEIVRRCREGTFRGDSRTLAEQLCISVDEVNLALARLLRLGLIGGEWDDRTGLQCWSEAAFGKLALDRVRQKMKGNDHALTRPAVSNPLEDAG